MGFFFLYFIVFHSIFDFHLLSNKTIPPITTDEHFFMNEKQEEEEKSKPIGK